MSRIQRPTISLPNVGDLSNSSQSAPNNLEPSITATDIDISSPQQSQINGSNGNQSEQSVSNSSQLDPTVSVLNDDNHSVIDNDAGDPVENLAGRAEATSPNKSRWKAAAVITAAFLIGAAAGFLVGGPVGALVGGALCAVQFGMTEKDFTGSSGPASLSQLGIDPTLLNSTDDDEEEEVQQASSLETYMQNSGIPEDEFLDYVQEIEDRMTGDDAMNLTDAIEDACGDLDEPQQDALHNYMMEKREQAQQQQQQG